MRVLRAIGYTRMPWKNGGGVTTQIAISPEGGALDAFDWRISMAQVDTDGAFSLFPGIDRTLLVLQGAGIDLSVAGRDRQRLDINSAPCPFPGDQPTHARLVDGPVLDLNIMSRRGRIRHTVTRFDLDTPREFAGCDATTVIVVERGGLIAIDDLGSEVLSETDSIVLTSDDAIRLIPNPSARVVLTTCHAIATSAGEPA